MYPLSLVHKKLIEEQAAGEWSNDLYTLYTLNPLAGIIDNFQRVLLKGLPPDFSSLLPGLVLTLVILPFSYLFFKRAEDWFADVI
jgi:lipopolysaccharide transport system permease protein